MSRAARILTLALVLFAIAPTTPGRALGDRHRSCRRCSRHAGARRQDFAAPLTIRQVGAGLSIAHNQISEAEYWALVQRSRDVVHGLSDPESVAAKRELANLAHQFEAANEVRTREGDVIAVDNGYLIDALLADMPALQQLEGMLQTLLDAHDRYPGKIFSSADLLALHEILAQPEFQWAQAQPNPINEWFQKIVTRFLNWLNSFLGNRLSVGVPQINVFSVAMTVILIIILYFVFRMIFADLVVEARLDRDSAESDELLTSQSAFQRAQQLSHSGDYRLAVRYLYLSSLLVLDERGLLRYDRSKTNREYLHSISDEPELAKPLAEIIEVFDDVWYGYHSLEEDSFRHYSDRVNELKEKKG